MFVFFCMLKKLFTVKIISILLLYYFFFNFPGASHYLYSFLLAFITVYFPLRLSLHQTFLLTSWALQPLPWIEMFTAHLGFAFMLFLCWTHCFLDPVSPFSWYFLCISQDRLFYAEVTATPSLRDSEPQLSMCTQRLVALPHIALLPGPRLTDPIYLWGLILSLPEENHRLLLKCLLLFSKSTCVSPCSQPKAPSPQN